jgi:hypothetical protein
MWSESPSPRSDCMLVWSAVGHRSPVRVRTSTLRGPRGTTATVDVEFVPATWIIQLRAPGHTPARELPPARTKFHRPLPLSAGQHLGVPGEFTPTLVYSNFCHCRFKPREKDNLSSWLLHIFSSRQGGPKLNKITLSNPVESNLVWLSEFRQR